MVILLYRSNSKKLRYAENKIYEQILCCHLMIPLLINVLAHFQSHQNEFLLDLVSHYVVLAFLSAKYNRNDDV